MTVVPVTRVRREEAFDTVRARVKAVEVVLDLGAGIRPQSFVRRPLVHICVDAHRPYLENLQKEVSADPRLVFLHGRWEAALHMLPDKSVDSVFALDFIEHLEKEDGWAMLREAERVARVQIVVYTPYGFFPQAHPPGAPDRWGLDGAAWQEHRSGWLPEDFGSGWQFVVCPDYILLDQHNDLLAEPVGAMWAFRDLGEPRSDRYLLMEDRSWWEHTKRAVEAALPGPAYRFTRRAWLAFRRLTRRGA
jgi:hypothetical protein